MINALCNAENLDLSSNTLFDLVYDDGSKHCKKLILKDLKNLAEALTFDADNIQNLTFLNLKGNKLGDEGAQILAEIIQSNTALKSIDISGNAITDKSVQSLIKALEQNTHLLSLDYLQAASISLNIISVQARFKRVTI